MKCPACSTEVPESAHYCATCGQAISSVSQLPTGLASPSVAEAARRKSSPATPIGRIAPSDPALPAGFAPGVLLAERYRIVGLVGRGGMGEVYRADDLKLGHPVALKFLPERLASEPGFLERFYAEVRHARQISHPNVCRVYDVAETDGRHFLSMEYVDGEDLASLLRRIGKLGGDRAVEIAREIVAGLAAAHDKGVLHRDLKPGNVMIDGRGRARITDFGLAVRSDEDRGGALVSGTPAYMAPEQLAGKGSSVQSDLYALGLVLYELFTGRKPFEAASLAEWRRKHSEEAPTSPSTVTTGLDPAVERAILRCLEKDPKARPRSAAAVAAALPGGDPLAAALAAGETPSPEMVAAAGSTEAMKPAAAWACLTAILGGIALVAWLSPKAYRHGHVPLDKPPEALVERSKEILRKLGFTEKPAGAAWGFSPNTEYRNWIEEHDRSRVRWQDIETGRPPGIFFWYRQSPATLSSERFSGSKSGGGTVTETDPPTGTAGMIGVRLDSLGRLIRLEAVPAADTPVSARAPDWPILFAEAGLDASAFKPTEPRWPAPFEADARMAWVESTPVRADRPLSVEAASRNGRPFYFELAGPWTRPPHAAPPESTGGTHAADLVWLTCLLLVILGGILLARHNLRLGRGDRQGAWRLAFFVFLSWFISNVLSITHVASPVEADLMFYNAGQSLLFGVFCWIAYIALEPLIRRRWPDSLISWTRLLSARFTDPLVGRTLLAGSLVGVFGGLLDELQELIRRGVEQTPPMPDLPWNVTLAGPRYVASHLSGAPAVSMMFALGVALLFFLARAILRKEWLAAAAAILIYAAPSFLTGGPVGGACALALAAAFVFVFLRFGLLALVFAFFFEHFLDFPLTTDPSAWYFGTSFFLMLVLAGLAVYGFRIATAGEPLVSGGRLEA